MTTPLLDRKPPQSLEAEQAVLGAMLVYRDAIGDVAGVLTPDDFTSAQHQALYRAIVELYGTQSVVDFVTVTTHLTNRGQLEAVGGKSYLVTLAEPAPAAWDWYAAEVREKALLRRMIQTSAENLRLVSDNPQAESAAGLLEQVRGSWEGIEAAMPDDGPRPLKSILHETIHRLEDQQAQPTQTGMATGFDRWDNLTGGLFPGRVYVFGGLQKKGKTTVVTNILAHLAFRLGVPCAMFSLEMKAGALAEKIMAMEAGVNSFRLRMADLEGDDWHLLANVVAAHENAPLYIDDRRGQTAEQIAAKARRVIRRHGVRVIAIDYFQLLGKPRGAENARLGYVEGSHILHALAGNENVALLLLAQLSRNVKMNPGKRPTSFDLQETASLAQDPDAVTLLHHLPDGEPNPRGNVLELIVSDNRHGPSGIAPVWWQPDVQRVRDLTSQELAGLDSGEGPERKEKRRWYQD